MKRTTAIVALFTLVLAASLPSPAQSLSAARSESTGRSFVEYANAFAISDGGTGVLIRWQMVFETRNIGFYVYRAGPGGPELVNPSIIGGLATRTNQATGRDAAYELYDRLGGAGSVYHIESLSADGRRSASASFTPKVTTDFELAAGHPRSYYEQLAVNTNGEITRLASKPPKPLQTIVDHAMLPPDPDTQHWVASQPGAKIAVKEDGMYRVTRAELESAGFNVNSDSAGWRLFEQGNEQAMIVGANDQYIEFYGRSLNAPDSDTRIYYLIADNAAGKRIDTRVMRNLGGNVVSTGYTAEQARKERTLYLSNILNGTAENYFGTLISDTPTTVPGVNDPRYVPFTISDIDPNVATAAVTVRVQGGGFVNGTHEIRVAINGREMGVMRFGNTDNFAATFTVPTSYLVEGPNFFQLVATRADDFSLFDSATVSYGRRYRAEDGRLAFFTPGYRRSDVTGFSSADVRVFDVTYDGSTQLLVNCPVVPDAGGFTARLPSDRAAMMYAVEDAAMLQPSSVTFNTPSTLSDRANAADVIIISHSAADFVTVAGEWANYRRTAAGGAFRAKVVDIADVYDEFSFGSQSSAAVKDLLGYAEANWQAPSPHYVLLIGDGSYDPRNYEGTGNWALVPSGTVNTPFLETESDDALVPDLDNDNVPDMAIGRIPARSAADVTTALNKAIAFETPAMWDLEHRGAVCAFSDALTGDYQQTCLAYMSHMPPGTPVTYVGTGDPRAHDEILAALNGGPYIANWSGHGTVGSWGPPGFFSIDDVPSLVNQDEQSIYTMLNCLQGYFIRPVGDSIAEALVKAPNGGGVATWAATVDTTPDVGLLVGERFYEQIALGQINRIGNLVVDAKSHTLPPGNEQNYSWVLLGDPALKVRP